MRPALVTWIDARVGMGFLVPNYDVLLAAAVVAAFYFALRDAERRQLDSEKVFRAGDTYRGLLTQHL